MASVFQACFLFVLFFLFLASLLFFNLSIVRCCVLSRSGVCVKGAGGGGVSFLQSINDPFF